MEKIISVTIVLATFVISLNAQKKETLEINAKLVDENNKPIAFATIYSKIKKRGTISKQNGDFSIKVTKNDTLELSAISYEKRQISALQIFKGDSIIVMKRKTYMLKDVDVMALRWYDFKHQVMESQAKEENQKVIQLPGLPSIYKPKVELGPYAGISNPVSFLLIYFSKQNIYKRRKERWRKVYEKYNMSKLDSALILQKINKKDSLEF